METKKTKTKKTKIIKKILTALLLIAAAAALYFATANLIVVASTDSIIFDLDGITGPEEDCDCIIVLGCGIRGDTPSLFLSDRLDTAIELYKRGFAPKLLMSGDHGRENYNEVGVMRQYAIDRGVPSEDIFMDHAGFSTYETMARAREVFGVRKAIVVTQPYHIARSVYDCRAYGIECRGVRAVQGGYTIHPWNYVRESIARSKDVIWCLIKPAPTYGGEMIDIHGSGEVTVD